MIAKHEEGFICLVCQKVALHKGNLKKHVVGMHLGDSSQNCDICGKRFKNLNSLQNHVSINHRGVGRLSWRNKLHVFNKSVFVLKVLTIFDFSSSALFAQLDRQISCMMERTGDKLWRCTECGKTASGKSDVTRHIEAIHLQHHPGFTCGLCGEAVKTRNALRQHRRLKHEIPLTHFWSTENKNTVREVF